MCRIGPLVSRTNPKQPGIRSLTLCTVDHESKLSRLTKNTELLRDIHEDMSAGIDSFAQMESWWMITRDGIDRLLPVFYTSLMDTLPHGMLKELLGAWDDVDKTLGNYNKALEVAKLKVESSKLEQNPRSNSSHSSSSSRASLMSNESGQEQGKRHTGTRKLVKPSPNSMTIALPEIDFLS